MDLLNTISNNRLWNKYGVHAAWALAIVCLLLAFSKIGWNIYSQRQIKISNYQPQEIEPIVKRSGPGYRISDVVSANLFGNPNPVKEVKKAPKTTLDLTLQGILWASDPSLARAIIKSGKKKSVLYSIGESIKGAGASVKEIRDGEVLLNRSGATESLPLIRQTTSGNREIITFSNPTQAPIIKAIANSASNTRDTTVRTSTRRPSTKPIAPNGAPRKVRKPNFSGLDKALKKMGEI